MNEALNLPSLLKQAIDNNDIAAMKELLNSEDTMNINIKVDEIGSVAAMSLSPLQYACRTGRVQIVELLLEKGALINQQDSYGDTPLYNACLVGHVEVVKLLLEKNADVKIAQTSSKNLPLHRACITGSVQIVRLLLEKAPDTINEEKLFGGTPLGIACGEDHIEIVKLLVEKGAAIDQTQSAHKKTLLHLACEYNAVKVAKFLIQNGVKLVPEAEDFSDDVKALLSKYLGLNPYAISQLPEGDIPAAVEDYLALFDELDEKLEAEKNLTAFAKRINSKAILSYLEEFHVDYKLENDLKNLAKNSVENKDVFSVRCSALMFLQNANNNFESVIETEKPNQKTLLNPQHK